MRLPITPVALGLGVAGLIPFVACGIGAVSGGAEQSGRWLGALLVYGAAILGFLGGVHWGFVLGPAEPAAEAAVSSVPIRPARPTLRLAFGVAPALAGWIGTIFPAELALVIQIAAFVLTLLAEIRLRAAGLVPDGYMVLRWGLTIVVVIVLTTVLVIHLLGGALIF